MCRKIILATVTSVFLLLSAVVSADPVMLVFTCELKEGHTKEEAMAVNAKWLSLATRAVSCGLTPIRISRPGAR
jgi:hypothetical protein